jgi:hypothetical protein
VGTCQKAAPIWLPFNCVSELNGRVHSKSYTLASLKVDLQSEEMVSLGDARESQGGVGQLWVRQEQDAFCWTQRLTISRMMEKVYSGSRVNGETGMGSDGWRATGWVGSEE